MAEYIDREAAIVIADYATDEHPYDKDPERPETFSDYNQGWHDACDYIRDKLENAKAADVAPVQRWIPVTERLPKRPPDRVDDQGRSWFTTGIECLVYDGKNVFAAHYCFMNKCFWYSDSLHPLKNITHWMPLPEPPKDRDFMASCITCKNRRDALVPCEWLYEQMVPSDDRWEKIHRILGKGGSK